MRIVIDTNVILSGLFWRGAPHALIDLVRAGKVELATSPVLLEELAEVMERPKFAAIIEKTTSTPERIVRELRMLADVVNAPSLPFPVCRDPDDDAVLACALAAQVELVVSGDADLLVLEQFEGIRIVSPTVALQMIEV